MLKLVDLLSLGVCSVLWQIWHSDLEYQWTSILKPDSERLGSLPDFVRVVSQPAVYFLVASFLIHFLPSLTSLIITSLLQKNTSVWFSVESHSCWNKPFKNALRQSFVHAVNKAKAIWAYWQNWCKEEKVKIWKYPKSVLHMRIQDRGYFSAMTFSPSDSLT